MGANGRDGLGCCCGKSSRKRHELPRDVGRRHLRLFRLCRARKCNTCDGSEWGDSRLPRSLWAIRSSTETYLLGHKVDFLANVETYQQMAAEDLASSAPVGRGEVGIWLLLDRSI